MYLYIKVATHLYRLRRHPADGQEAAALLAVVLGLVDVARHPEVADLDDDAAGDHAVPGGQVAVHDLLDAEVAHPVRDVQRHLQHVRQRGRGEAAPVVLRVRAEVAEIVLEVAVLHELHEDEGGLALADHAYQLDDVLGVVILHDARLLQELDLLPVAGLLVDCLHGARHLTLQQQIM